MTAINTVRQDINNIINETNEYASNITFTRKIKTYADDNSLESETEIEKTVLALIFPNNNSEMKVDEQLGQIEFGSSTIFLKYIYEFDDINIIPQVDDIVTDVNGVKHRITQLKPWTVNQGVGYWEGTIQREDLN